MQKNIEKSDIFSFLIDWMISIRTCQKQKWNLLWQHVANMKMSENESRKEKRIHLATGKREICKDVRQRWAECRSPHPKGYFNDKAVRLLCHKNSDLLSVVRVFFRIEMEVWEVAMMKGCSSANLPSLSHVRMIEKICAHRYTESIIEDPPSGRRLPDNSAESYHKHFLTFRKD